MGQQKQWREDNDPPRRANPKRRPNEQTHADKSEGGVAEPKRQQSQRSEQKQGRRRIGEGPLAQVREIGLSLRDRSNVVSRGKMRSSGPDWRKVGAQGLE